MADEPNPRVTDSDSDLINRQMDAAFLRNVTRDLLRRGDLLLGDFLVAALAAIDRWQATPSVPRLTCGNDSGHPLLTATVEDQRIVLRCPTCDYRQTTIPPEIMELRPEAEPETLWPTKARDTKA